ncbi:MAG: hypothetical protein GX072_08235 [Lysinibacillus sp.]|nr:hypothetical protein [Lysinibacillus sp.]
MKKWLLSLLIISVLLVGCASDEPEIDTNEGPIDVSELLVNVEILTPEEVAVGEPIELAVHVTQNNENVVDVDALEFEVWESGYRDEAKMIDGEHVGDGIYKAEFTFEHDGVYYMYAHTTARGLHVMPKQKIIAGEPDMSQVIPEADTSEEDYEKWHSDDGHAH